MRRQRLLLPLVGLALGLLPGCGEEPTQTITDVRDRDTVRREVPEGMSAARRYGYRRPNDAAHGGAHGGGQGGAMTQQFGWTTPAGWTEKPRTPGSMRRGSWSIDAAPRADCSLITLGGTGGGLAANVNRWRGEMGLEPLEGEAIAALPRRTLIGGEAVYLDMTGAFGGGMGGSGPIPNARMLGLIRALPQAMIFLKLTGPAEAVAANKAAFESLADSITFGTAPAAAGTTPKAGPSAGAAKGPSKPTGFLWAAPDGWEQQPARMMRIVTFVPKDAPTAWCYVSRLGGTAGGLAMNINRWRGEMGINTPLDDAGVAKLETIDMLGTKATLLDVEGNFSGTGGPPQQGVRMLGVVCPRENDVVFVKMVGPPDAIAKHRAAFLALCTSLQEDR